MNKGRMRASEHRIRRTLFRTPFGWAGAAATERGILGIVLPKNDLKLVERELDVYVCVDAQRRKPMPPLSKGRKARIRPLAKGGAARTEKILRKAVKLLQKYFAGKRVSFDLPLDISYYTPFQQAVWHAAEEIAYGETRSYAWVARRIKNARAARAVGSAMGANPVPIIVP